MITKNKVHIQAVHVFQKIRDDLYKEHIAPFKHLKKQDRPLIPQKVLDRIKRNERYVNEYKNMKNFILIIIFIFTGMLGFSQSATYKEVTEGEVKYKRFISYQAQNGEIYNVKDTLVFGVSLGYYYQNIRRRWLGSYVDLSSQSQGEEQIIVSFSIWRQRVIVETRSIKKGLKADILNFEAALFHGEIYKKGYIDSFTALNILKEEYIKYELGLITKEEYEQRKKELASFIY